MSSTTTERPDTESAASAEAPVRRPERLGQRISVVIRSRIATSSIDLIAAIVLVRLLAPEQFAVLSLVLVIYELGRQISLMGFPDSVLYYTAQLPVTQHRALLVRTMRSVAFASAGVGAFICVMAWSVALWLPNWSAQSVQTLRTTLPVIALAGLIEFPTWTTTQFLLARERERWAGVYEASTSALLLACIVVPIALELPVSMLAYAILAYAVIRAAVSFVLLRAASPHGRDALPVGFGARQARYAVPLGIHSFVGRANRYVDRFMIGFFLTEAALSSYHVAAQEVPLIKAFPMGFAGVMIPLYARLRAQGKVAAVHDLWLRSIRVVGAFSIFVSAFLFVAAPDVIAVLFGDEYRGAVMPFRIFAAVTFLKWAHFGSIPQAWNDTTSILRVSVIALGVNFALNIPFTYFWGISGAAAATVIATVTVVGLVLWINARHLGCGLRGVAPWRALLGYTAVASACGAGAEVARLTFLADTAPWMRLAATFVLFVALALFVTRLTGQLTTDHARGALYLLGAPRRADRLDAPSLR